MSIPLVLAAALQTCAGAGLTLEQAQGLALIASAPHVAKGVPVGVDVEETGPLGWKLRVHGVNGCEAGIAACSSLIGYYVVEARSGAVTDDDGHAIRTARLDEVAARMLREDCRARR